MDLFDVYPLFDIEPVKALDSIVWDKNGTEYLDMYGGHAVISIGHSHPKYVQNISNQVKKIGFYSNSVLNPLQEELSSKLGELSGLKNWHLFLINSGAEANENALKLASFHTKRKKVLAFHKSFHGRTSAAVAVTDNPSIKALINDDSFVQFVPFNDAEAVKDVLNEEFAAVIVEGIQGIGGINVATNEFQKAIREACDKTGAIYIHDSIQCGYGRSGKFFSFQDTPFKPDLITVAKGMGNGFPIGGTLISPEFIAKFGMLGTTFGGNHLACMAGITVLDVIKEEGLIGNAEKIGSYLINELKTFKQIKEVRGKGLMIGIEFEQAIGDLRKQLLYTDKIFTGVAGQNIIRLLPSLTLSKEHADQFLSSFRKYVK